MSLRRTFVEQIMGLPFSIQLRGPAACQPATAALAGEVFADLRRIDALFSTYRNDSQISRINAGTLHPDDADPLLREVFGLAELAHRLTDGLFNIHLPDADGRPWIDPSGLVKGWAAQRGFDRLTELAGHDVCLNAGGDVAVSTAGGRPAWRVGIENPQGTGVVGVLQLASGAVASSGTGVRGAHLIDPRDGSRPQLLQQVSVTGPSLIWADVLATAAFIRGADAVLWLGRHHPDYQGLVITSAGLILATPGLELS